MGIEHRIKDETEADYWKCPHCDGVFDFAIASNNCQECGEPVEPFQHPATWQDFWDYCQRLKT